MDRFLIYVNYNQDEIANEFYLAFNNDIVIKYCRDEEIDWIFEEIAEKGEACKSFEVYVIKDKEALDWDYLKAFQEHDIRVCKSNNIDKESICQLMNTLFEGEYTINLESDVKDKKLIEIIYTCNGSLLSKEGSENIKIPRQAEEILNHGGEETTELARIIKEKYERMSRNGKL